MAKTFKVAILPNCTKNQSNKRIYDLGLGIILKAG